MEIEHSASPNILSPLMTETLLSDIPLFGPGKADVDSLLEQSLENASSRHVAPGAAVTETKPAGILASNASVAEKMAAMRLQWEDEHPETNKKDGRPSITQLSSEPASQQDRHQEFLAESKKLMHLSTMAEDTIHHVMLLRAKENYLFDFERNESVVADDCWLKDVWAWVGGML
jgi:hypothetical protein